MNNEKPIILERRGLKPLSIVQISERDWTRIVNKFNQLTIPSFGKATWLSIFSGALLTDISFLLTLLLSNNNTQAPTIIWVIIIFFGLIFLFGLFWNIVGMRNDRNTVLTTRQDILDEIKYIEESWTPIEDTNEIIKQSNYLPEIGEILPNTGILIYDKPNILHISGKHTAGYSRIRWVRLFLGPSDQWNKNWTKQIYMSINPNGRLNLWDSQSKPHTTQIPGRGKLETDVAIIDLNDTELTLDNNTLRFQFSLIPKIRGSVNAYLTTVSNPDKNHTGIVKVGEFTIE